MASARNDRGDQGVGVVWSPTGPRGAGYYHDPAAYRARKAERQKLSDAAHREVQKARRARAVKRWRDAADRAAQHAYLAEVGNARDPISQELMSDVPRERAIRVGAGRQDASQVGEYMRRDGFVDTVTRIPLNDRAALLAIQASRQPQTAGSLQQYLATFHGTPRHRHVVGKRKRLPKKLSDILAQNRAVLARRDDFLAARLRGEMRAWLRAWQPNKPQPPPAGAGDWLRGLRARKDVPEVRAAALPALRAHAESRLWEHLARHPDERSVLFAAAEQGL